VICKEGNINSNTINNFTTVDCFRKSGDLNANQEQSSIGNFNFNLYPNPAQDFIKIISNDAEYLSESQILVYDYSGRLVKNGGSFINQITLNLEDLKSGMYIAQIVNQNQSTQYKFKIE